jgi:cytochrome c oxidase assembly protein subunit 15
VHAESTAVARFRALEVAPQVFRRLSFASVGALFVIVATGATVRLTGSGLGCEHWPGCRPGHPFPEKDYHSYIEFSNRLVGGVTILLTLIAWAASTRVRALPGGVRRLALGVFVGALLQAPLGALSVYVHLHPAAVIPHLLLSMAVLGGAVVVALEAVALDVGHVAPLVPEEVRRYAPVVAAAAFALVVSGTFATAAGPHSGGERVARFGRLDVMLVVHAGAVAVFGIGLVFGLGYLAAQRARSPRLFRLACALVGLVLVQMGLGDIQYRTHLPWWLVLVHVSLAAAVWAFTVALVTLVRRPLASLEPAAHTLAA